MYVSGASNFTSSTVQYDSTSPVCSINCLVVRFYVPPHILNCLCTHTAFCCHSLWQSIPFVHIHYVFVCMGVCESVWIVHLFLLIIELMWRECGHTIFRWPLVHQNRRCTVAIMCECILLLVLWLWLFILTEFFSPVLIMKISYRKSTHR